MRAVIKSGGKQYKVTEGDQIKVEKLNAKIGDVIGLSEVLMLIDGSKTQIGKPYLKDSSVSAEVLAHDKGEKINIIKFKRRKHYLRKMGHRQIYTTLKIKNIVVN